MRLRKKEVNLVEHYPHDMQKSKRIWDKDYVNVISIDPAILNYAIRIERRYKNGDVKTIVFHKISISDKTDYDNSCNNLFTFLDKLKKHFITINFVIMEKQPNLNPKIERIAAYTIAYFVRELKNLPLLPSIFEINSKLKGRMLNVPKKLKRIELKKWGIEVATSMLEDREDTFSLDILAGEKKKDDLCDTVIQSEAFFIYCDRKFEDYKLI
jgi:hypothetical protein